MSAPHDLGTYREALFVAESCGAEDIGADSQNVVFDGSSIVGANLEGEDWSRLQRPLCSFALCLVVSASGNFRQISNLLLWLLGFLSSVHSVAIACFGVVSISRWNSLLIVEYWVSLAGACREVIRVTNSEGCDILSAIPDGMLCLPCGCHTCDAPTSMVEVL